MSNSDRRNSSRQSQEIDQNLYYEEPEYTLPRNGLTRAILIGFVGGVVALAVSIGIVVFHASLFNEGARLGDNMPLEVASAISSWSLVGVAVDIIVAFVVGLFVGRVAVKRSRGFWAGAIVGFVIQFGIFVAQYIPGYPGVISGNGMTSLIQRVLGFVTSIFFYALFGGLLGWLGTRIVTRKHPYYRLQRQKARLKE
jgi:hypothetical protein